MRKARVHQPIFWEEKLFLSFRYLWRRIRRVLLSLSGKDFCSSFSSIQLKVTFLKGKSEHGVSYWEYAVWFLSLYNIYNVSLTALVDWIKLVPIETVLNSYFQETRVIAPAQGGVRARWALKDQERGCRRTLGLRRLEAEPQVE